MWQFLLLVPLARGVLSHNNPKTTLLTTYLETSPGVDYSFYNVSTMSGFYFSVRASKTIHICLSNSLVEYKFRDSMLEIVLGAANNKKSYIHWNKIILAEVDTPGILNDTELQTFYVVFESINMTDGHEINISVGYTTEQFLQYRGPLKFYPVQFAGFRSDSISTWELDLMNPVGIQWEFSVDNSGLYIYVNTYPNEEFQYFRLSSQNISFMVEYDDRAEVVLAKTPDNRFQPYRMQLNRRKIKPKISENKTTIADIQLNWSYSVNKNKIRVMNLYYKDRSGSTHPLFTNKTDINEFNYMGIRSVDSFASWKLNLNGPPGRQFH